MNIRTKLADRGGAWWTRMGLSGLVTASCAFWTWFVVSVWIGEGAAAASPAMGFLAVLVPLGVCVWKWPRATASLLLVAGTVAAVWLHHWAARAFMAGPMLVGGAGILVATALEGRAVKGV